MRGLGHGGKTDGDLDATNTRPTAPRVELLAAEGGTRVLALGGSWTVRCGRTPPPELTDWPGVAGKVRFDLRQVAEWDSTLIAWLLALWQEALAHGIELDLETLPDGVRNTLALALAVPERTDAHPVGPPISWVGRLGLAAQRGWKATGDIATFVGECALALAKLLRGRAPFRRADLWLFMQEAGAEALPINLLISFLVGLILAFVGAVQLEQFGASIYVANLVAIAMVREMGCIMAGIIMCGRTGAAYAAQLGTMKVNQEIDAFRTFLFDPVSFLVLPRMLALFLMMPLLTVFANLAGIAGGVLIGVSMLDLTPLEYWNQTIHALTIQHCAAGFLKSFVFGLIVAVAGCYNGMRCPNNAAGVGQATTTAVVAGITAIVVADAVFAVLFNVFDF